MEQTVKKQTWRTQDLCYIAVCAVLIAAGAWISVPTTVPFTMQTFSIFLVLALLGGRRGFFSVAVYLLLGAAGLPVFAGFKAGAGTLLGATGGYLLGFLFTALIFWGVTHWFGNGRAVTFLALLLGLAVCYTFGTAWFLVVYARTSGAVGLWTALGWCVFPFLIPDVLKLVLALWVSRALRPALRA